MNKYYIMVILILTISLTNCTKFQTTNDLDERNLAVFDKYIKAFYSGDFEALENILSDDFMIYGNTMSNSESKKLFIEKWKNDYVKCSYKTIIRAPIHITEGEENGDWVGEWEEVIVPTKNGLSSTKVRVHEVCKFKDGKIIKSITYYNEADVMGQLGFKFIPPEVQQPENK